MLSWAIVWDVFKFAIFPVVAIIWQVFKYKVIKLEEDIDDLKKLSNDFDRKMIKLESSMVTQEQLREFLESIQKSVEKGNEGLEKRLEKTIDLTMTPIKESLAQLATKK